MGAIEGQMAIQKGKFDTLSKQEIIECVTAFNWLLGCGGGYDTAAYNYSKITNGVTTAKNNPYVGTTVNKTCKPKLPRTPGSAVASWNVLPKNETIIRDILFTVGPLYIVFYVASDFYNYAGGIYTDIKSQCQRRYPNHAVLLVGYGTENGTDYWILRNSWSRTQIDFFAHLID